MGPVVQEAAYGVLLAGSGSFFVAVLHLSVVFVRPSAYSFFGSERLGRLAVTSSSSPAIRTLIHSRFALSFIPSCRSPPVARILWGA